jgi:hypothetical protein
MSVFTPPNGTPKDVNNRLGSAKGLDPDDPNDTAFKLVTICVFILCRKKLNNFFFFREQDGVDNFLLFWVANGVTKERERGAGPRP